jgi:hypothetical protein
LQADEVTPPLDTPERAADGINLIMARLMNILDSWISFEDNVMEELDASEHAAQNVMRGIVGEVDLVDRTSAAITGSLVDDVMPQFPNIHILFTSIQRLYTPLWKYEFVPQSRAHLKVVNPFKKIIPSSSEFL